MSVHPEFAEHVRAQLVNPVRNVRRAISAMNAGNYSEAEDYLATIRDQIAYLSGFVDEENARHVHTCSCGHVHYVQAEDPCA